MESKFPSLQVVPVASCKVGFFFFTSVLYLILIDSLDCPWYSSGEAVLMAGRDWRSCIIRNQHLNRCPFSCNLPFLSLPPVTCEKKELVLLQWRGICGEPFMRAGSLTARGQRNCTWNVTYRKTLASKRSLEATSDSNCASWHQEVELPMHILEQGVQPETGMLGLEGAKPRG